MTGRNMQTPTTYALFYVSFTASPHTSALIKSPHNTATINQVVVGSTSNETSKEVHLKAITERLSSVYSNLDVSDLMIIGDNRHDTKKLAHWIPKHEVFIISYAQNYSPYLKSKNGIDDKSLSDLFPDSTKARNEIKALMQCFTDTNNKFVPPAQTN
jgi:hypothetical protein